MTGERIFRFLNVKSMMLISIKNISKYAFVIANYFVSLLTFDFVDV